MLHYMFWRVVAFAFLCLLSACSLFQGEKEELTPQQMLERQDVPEIAALYYKGEVAYENKDWQLTIDSFDLYFKRANPPFFDFRAFYYWARAHEEIGNFKKALEGYRRYFNSQSSYDPRLKAMALYRTSFALEATGEDEKVVATLIDTQRFAAFLPDSVVQAELPARLAGAYARAGNPFESERYYKQAEKGIIALKQKQSKDQDDPEWISQTLYYMGFMSLRTMSYQNFFVDIKPLLKSQDFLLQSVEQNNKVWSAKSLHELNAIYRDIWNTIQSLPDAEDLLAKRERQAQQKEMATKALEMIMVLQNTKLPLQEENNSFIKDLLAMADQEEERLSKLLREPVVGEDLTPDAQSREGILRQGIIRSSDESILEKKQKQKKHK